MFFTPSSIAAISSNDAPIVLPWPAVCSSRIIVFPRGRAFSTSVSALEMSESACSTGAVRRAPG